MTVVVARLPGRWTSGWLTVGVVGMGAVLGVAVVLWMPLTVASVAAVALAAMVAAHPPVAAYVLLVVTPLIVGVSRDSVLPLLRPNEALALVLGAGLVLRGIVGCVAGRPRQLKFTAVDASLVVLAVTGSVLPVLWMLARGVQVTHGDLLYAAVLWKYFAIYLIVRTSVRTEREVARCLWLTIGVYSLVAVVGILQALKLFGVPQLLTRYYESETPTTLQINRATSTLASWLAMADVMIFNLAIVAGWLVRLAGRRRLLFGAMLLLALGCLAAGDVSGLLALIAAVVAIGVLAGRLRDALRVLVPFLLVAGLILSPVIGARLHQIDPSTGLPLSWVGRQENLRTRILPEFTSVPVVLLGVRPEARVRAPETLAADWVYIESGHLWLLWTGGLPMLVAFFVFLWVALRATAPIARRRRDAIGVAATASFVGIVVLTVGTIFDPHLTHRGTADLNFALLAMALAGQGSGGVERASSPTIPTSQENPA